jgi:hypothetical protein
MVDRPLTSPITDENKSAALDFIFENALKSGFGTLSKTELDTILFAAIIEFGEKNSTTDLELSKYLQITQRRVQSLREKISIKYLEPISREKAIRYFVDQLGFAKKEDKYIDIPINDIAVKNEIEGLLDENHMLLHYQLNSKIFRLRIDDLLELVLLIESNKTGETLSGLKEKIVDSIKKSEGAIKDLNITIECNDENKIYHNLNQKIIKSGVDVGLAIIKATVPGGGIAVEIIEKLMANFGIQ